MANLPNDPVDFWFPQDPELEARPVPVWVAPIELLSTALFCSACRGQSVVHVSESPDGLVGPAGSLRWSSPVIPWKAIGAAPRACDPAS